MPTTANFSLEYPDDNSSVDIAGHFETLADDVDAAINTRLALTGGTLTGALVGTLTTDSSSSTTGAFKTAGGMGIAKALYVGTTLNVTGATTLTGDLTVSKAAPYLTVNSTSGHAYSLMSRPAGSRAWQYFQTAGSTRWTTGVSADAESGANAGSNYTIAAWNDAGSALSTPLTITRSTGAVTLTGDLTISKASATARINATSGDSEVHIDRTAGNGAYVVARTGTSSRWRFGSGSDVESGSNVGSDFILGRFSDAGSYIDAPLTVYRSTGKVSIGSVGATAGLQLGAGGPRMMSGTGSPEGVVTAPIGSIWFQSDSTVGVTHWKKASGVGNTGWVVMSGDTGWRDVSASLDATFLTADPNARLFIRRTNDSVSVSFQSGTSATFTTNYQNIYTVPTGFRATVSTGFGVPFITLMDSASATATTKTLYVNSSSLTNGNGWASGANYWGEMTYTTTNAWPTSLPGSAA